MNYANLKLFQPVKNIVVSPGGVDGKNICFAYLGENVNFFDGLRLVDIKPNFVRWVFIPSMKRPINYIMSSQYRDEILKMGLKPIRGFFSDLSEVDIPRNMYINFDLYLNMLIKRFNITNFNSIRGNFIINTYLEELDKLDSNDYEKVLLYVINSDKLVSEKMFDKKIFPIFKTLFESKSGRVVKFPFDKILVLKYSISRGKNFLLVFDKNKKIDISRMKSVFFKKIVNDNEISIESEQEDKDILKESKMIEYISNLL